MILEKMEDKAKVTASDRDRVHSSDREVVCYTQ